LSASTSLVVVVVVVVVFFVVVFSVAVVVKIMCFELVYIFVVDRQKVKKNHKDN